MTRVFLGALFLALFALTAPTLASADPEYTALYYDR